VQALNLYSAPNVKLVQLPKHTGPLIARLSREGCFRLVRTAGERQPFEGTKFLANRPHGFYLFEEILSLQKVRDA
jgi:hypothetical protein